VRQTLSVKPSLVLVTSPAAAGSLDVRREDGTPTFRHGLKKEDSVYLFQKFSTSKLALALVVVHCFWNGTKHLCPFRPTMV
jgi:hypothetical protein